ncbi:MAG: hypothetical protein ABR549_08520 [Mycobacteriales bacterium]
MASQLWLDADNGFAVNPPWGYVDNDPSVYAYPAYSDAMGVWDLIDAIKSISA